MKVAKNNTKALFSFPLPILHSQLLTHVLSSSRHLKFGLATQFETLSRRKGFEIVVSQYVWIRIAIVDLQAPQVESGH